MEFLAYLDPGTGSLVLQAVVGGILAVGIVIKAYWSKIVGLFSKSKKSDDSDKPKAE